ncbi:hypothetical protein [Candidatus Ichthyocystis sparus]|uniref:hypothetical protein n=1 Tax=Candidatus Ichthyocystis sparus TaxID=1561004 RepID=UPI000B8122BC|nr:hypothetical protein [Candidatus Ichthyocystis sparus]
MLSTSTDDTLGYEHALLSSIDDCVDHNVNVSDVCSDTDVSFEIDSQSLGQIGQSSLSGASALSSAPVSLLFALSTLTILAGTSLAEYTTVNQDNSIASTTSPKTTTTTLPSYTGDSTPGVSEDAGALSALFISIMVELAIIACIIFTCHISQRATNNQGPDLQQGPAFQEEDNAGNQLNGHAMVGHRDQGDHPGEIIELNEVPWGWGYIPAEVVPMVVMGRDDAREGEREEGGEMEDAV